MSNISVDANFFELGGHSLLAVRLLSEVEKVVGRKIPLASIFRGSTVRLWQHSFAKARNLTQSRWLLSTRPVMDNLFRYLQWRNPASARLVMLFSRATWEKARRPTNCKHAARAHEHR